MPTLTLSPSGAKTPFDTIEIGGLFYYMNRFWVKITTYSGKDTVEDDKNYGICAFHIHDQNERTAEKDLDDRGFIMVTKVDTGFS